MRVLSGIEEKTTKKLMDICVELATQATCLRSHGGSVLVFENQIIGGGYNSPPLNKESQRRCLYNKEKYNKKVTDKTCCIHAKQRAMMNALKKNPKKIEVHSYILFVYL